MKKYKSKFEEKTVEDVLYVLFSDNVKDYGGPGVNASQYMRFVDQITNYIITDLLDLVDFGNNDKEIERLIQKLR